MTVSQKSFDEFKGEMVEFKGETGRIFRLLLDKIEENGDRIDKMAKQMNEKYDRLLTIVGGTLKELQTIRQEQTMIHHRVYDEHEVKIEDHEERIGGLEEKVAIA